MHSSNMNSTEPCRPSIEAEPQSPTSHKGNSRSARARLPRKFYDCRCATTPRLKNQNPCIRHPRIVRSLQDRAASLDHHRLLVRDAPDHDAVDRLRDDVSERVPDLLERRRVRAAEADALE